MLKRLTFQWSIAVLALCSASADVRMPAVFGDHMVVQQRTSIPVWGWAEPGEKVTVSFAGKEKTATADSSGKWMVKLGTVKAGGPYTLTVRGMNTLSFNDVLVGEVWLCSGQSNMAMSLNRIHDSEREIASANYPKIRMYQESSSPAEQPDVKGAGQWRVCDPTVAGQFSAVAFLFGRGLHEKLNVPIGLVHTAVGGTPVESWISLDALKAQPDTKPLFDHWAKVQAGLSPEAAAATYRKQLASWTNSVKKAIAAGRPPPEKPSAPQERVNKQAPARCFNGRIAPVYPYAIRGAIWYQGEANTHTVENAQAYAKRLPLMIADWRARWGQGKFPMAWVQLPRFHKPAGDPNERCTWAIIRESMARAASSTTPNSGMTVNIDLGEADDIHPRDKQPVGERLVLWALANVYGRNVKWQGPTYRSHKKDGGKIIVSFDHADGGLRAKGELKGFAKGFALAGADRKWHWAGAEISGDRVVVSSDAVPSPVAVRYAWADNPEAPLFNGAGLPMAPFRTDDWPFPETPAVK